MSTKPILFNADMVRALLDGRKTVTRRVVKPRSPKACGFYVTHRKSDGAFMGVYDYDEHERMFDSPQAQPAYPGDVLYVRETWARYHEHFLFKVDCPDTDFMLRQRGVTIKWRPSIHMPREAARIFLRVTDVRVERLQDITEEQAIAEGIQKVRDHEYRGTWRRRRGGRGRTMQNYYSPIAAFHHIWDSTIHPVYLGLYGWDANPWVWVIGFERCEKPKEGAP